MEDRMKTVFESDADEFPAMNGDSLVEWINELARDNNCELGDLGVEFEQFGDQWDGYSIATVRVTCPMTQEDIVREAVESEQRRAANLRQAEERERAELERLQRKYQPQSGTPQ